MISRTTAVFAFESTLATHKRWNARHKNGNSEGSSMFCHFWVDNMVNLLIAVCGYCTLSACASGILGDTLLSPFVIAKEVLKKQGKD
jgi:hypothetical protein